MEYIVIKIGESTLKLPSQELVSIASESDFYGAKNLLADYLGENSIHSLKGVWQHGWIPDYTMIDPLVVTTSMDADQKIKPFYVAKLAQKEYLEKHHYKKIKVIGAPIIYLPKIKFKKIKRSLLVMPAHSLDKIDNKINFRNYAAQINSLKKDFDLIVVCLHSSCIKKGYWIDEFAEYNIPYIEGSNVSDRNCLYRLQALFSQFEYVTSNGYGSHLPYSAYFGAKTSIFGDYGKILSEDRVNEPYYKKYPQLLNTFIPLLSEKNVKKQFPILFCEPSKAIEQIEWAKYELGYNNKLNKKEVRKIILIKGPIMITVLKKIRLIYSLMVPEVFKLVYRYLRYPKDLESIREKKDGERR